MYYSSKTQEFDKCFELEAPDRSVSVTVNRRLEVASDSRTTSQIPDNRCITSTSTQWILATPEDYVKPVRDIGLKQLLSTLSTRVLGHEDRTSTRASARITCNTKNLQELLQAFCAIRADPQHNRNHWVNRSRRQNLFMPACLSEPLPAKGNKYTRRSIVRRTKQLPQKGVTPY